MLAVGPHVADAVPAPAVVGPLLATFVEVLFNCWVLILVFVVTIEAFNFQNEPVDFLGDSELTRSISSARACSDQIEQ